MKEHIGTVNLETDRLCLSRFELADCHEMYQNWASDPLVTKYLRWNTHKDWTITAQILNLWISEYEQNPAFYQWAVHLKADNTLIGTISAFPFNENGDFEIGYCYGRSFWNNGFATEALKCVCGLFFNELNFEKLYCRHDVNNPASGAVMQKAGFIYTGECTDKKFDGTIVNCKEYILYKKDYKK